MLKGEGRNKIIDYRLLERTFSGNGKNGYFNMSFKRSVIFLGLKCIT